MKNKDLLDIGIPAGDPLRSAMEVIKQLANDGKRSGDMRLILSAVVQKPGDFLQDGLLGDLAEKLHGKRYVARETPAPYKQWGEDLEAVSIQQMLNGCSLPVAERGALMPDAHPGYGLPIGGVLATNNAVIPYAVGVDIACRMKLSVFDIPVKRLLRDEGNGRFTGALNTETKFGVGGFFREKRQHDVMDRDWSVSPITQQCKDKAWKQLGTSGSGNHFVEFGEIEISDTSLGVALGTYVALMSHSGSRGTGANVAAHYSKLAKDSHPELPKELQHLAWLDLDSQDGQEYWKAMELMGHYAAANHACIHKHVAENLGLEPILDVENHHNFAWKEQHDGKEVIVHRKGATPAGEGVLGVIPGSMASPAYVVRGKGNPESLNSASHGAGRVMSRKQAASKLNWKDANKLLQERGVRLLSAGIDEVPYVYKDIDEVMAAQSDLVEPLARFFPRLVKMAPAGERPED
ncbi:RtcB family protein [Pelagicoccus sp. SDUM812003]|uniref:RtcB family protein n=1 Tax=Pelagicoccus sp. SDUM812003 TaxID=3041267 RepID=UPI0028107736|nr:RtcB family protein [Pelagicoccus sp. SDUM812003]MDQ8205663.1 RtcB family protein [Pelagicoccus sp. SDUM812003]